MKIKGKWHYLYQAIDKNGQTLDWMLSRHRNKKSVKRFFRKNLGNSYITPPRVINVDKNPTFPPAHHELQIENEFPQTTKLRQVKYLNNLIEKDHKVTKGNYVIDNGIKLLKLKNTLSMVWKRSA